MVVAGVLAAVAAAGADDGSRFADFIYADANEGSASGGHVALRLGDRTYHFGYQEPGVLRLDRDDSARFLHVYGSLENRNLRVLRVEVSADTFERLRASFNQRYLSEVAEFEALEGLTRDREFAQAWARGEPMVTLRGAGYFVTDGEDPWRGPSSPALERLRQRVIERYGPEFLPAKRAAARAVLESLPAAANARTPELTPPAHHPAQGYGYSKRAAGAEGLALALDVLQHGAPLREGTTVALEPEDFPIDAPIAGMLQSFSVRLESDLVDLVSSSRPDVGFVLLVGMARLVALEQTLREKRLVVLDAFPAAPLRLSVGEIESRGGRLARITPELATELRRVRHVLRAKSSPRESDYAALEALANRYGELERSRATGDDLRVARGRLLPVRPARRALALESPSDGVLAERVAELRAREEEQRERLDGEHHYNLLAHNCVSELFAQIERGLVDTPARLGGRVAPGRGLEFIPFLAAEAVESTYRVREVVTVPSHRRRRVDQMRKREGLIADLRESNVLTSTVYAPNSLDSAFLFFTDETIVARPLLGLANLLYSLGATVVGVPVAPFDDGRLLAAGLRGSLWSVPELAFVNVRKGSFFFVPREESAPAGQPW